LCAGCSLTDLEDLQGGTGASSGTVGPGSGGHAGMSGQGGSGGAVMPMLEGYGAEVLLDQPLGYWRLGENREDVAHDELGAHDGQYVGGVELGAPGALTDGNSAARFDGAADHVEVGLAFDFADRTAFSIEAWVNPTLLAPLGGSVASKNFQDEVTGVTQGYKLAVGSDGVTLTRYGTTFIDACAAPPIAEGSYSHIVGSYDGDVLSIFVNGGFAASLASTGDLIAHNGTFLLGASWAHSQLMVQHYMGALDEVAVYGHALSQERVLAHFNAGQR
jgi:hypothetical protein